MQKLLLAGILLMILFSFGCGGSSGGDSSGVKSATIDRNSSVEGNQYGDAVFGKATIE